MLESHAVAHLGGLTAVDELHAAHGKVFLILMGRTDGTLYDVAGLQAVFLDLLGRYVHIVGRREVVVVRAAEEAVAVGEALQHAVGGDDLLEVELRTTCLGIINGLCLLGLMAGGTVEHIECGDGTVVLDGDVDDGDEVGTVAGIAHPYTFGVDLVGRGVFAAGGHLLTQFLDGVGGVGILLGSEVGSLGNEVCSLGHETLFGH